MLEHGKLCDCACKRNAPIIMSVGRDGHDAAEHVQPTIAAVVSDDGRQRSLDFAQIALDEFNRPAAAGRLRDLLDEVLTNPKSWTSIVAVEEVLLPAEYALHIDGGPISKQQSVAHEVLLSVLSNYDSAVRV